MTDELKYYSFDEVCEILKISQPTLNGILKEGDLEGHRIGHKWLFSKEQIQAYLEKRTIKKAN